MSINSLTNAAISRRMDFTPLDTTPKTYQQIATAAAAIPRSREQAAAGADDAGNQVNTALHVLFGYIPTEVLTLYVAVLAAVQKPGQVTRGDWTAFWVFLVATPVIVWLVYGTKLKAVQKPLPWKFDEWPLWEMSAAVVAYGTWAFALPNTPFTQFNWYSSGLAGISVLVASTGLGLLAPLFQKSLG
jgi:hypothetical protein